VIQKRSSTLAIVGSHPDTRAKFDFTREDCDIWIFNEALDYGKGSGFAPKADAVFQIHQPVIWRSSVNRNDPNHYKWLKSGNTPQIIMLDKYEDVPKSEKYPLDGILNDLFNQTNIRYFTSSVAYVIALGVHLAYEAIEIYGIEMETNTEYMHQRPGVALMIGIAIGRGMKVDFVSDRFFNAPLYGYEGSDTVALEYYKGRAATYKPMAQKYDKEFAEKLGRVTDIFDRYIADYKNGLSDIDEAILDMSQAAHDFGMHDGCQQVNERFIAKCEQMIKETGDYIIVRQEYEGSVGSSVKAKTDAIQRYNQAGIMLEQAVDKLKAFSGNKSARKKEVDKVRRTLAEYVKLATEIGIATGVGSENNHLMKTLDDLMVAAGSASAIEVMATERARRGA